MPIKLEIRPSPTPPSRALASRCNLGALLLAAAATLTLAQAPSVPTPPEPPPVPPQPRFVVLLDAAHGGDDPGGQLNGEPEKTFTLALSVCLRSLLAARGFQVVTTRESDSTLDFDRRAEIANRSSAQACLSLHATETGSGVHLFASSLSPAAPARIPAWKTAQSAWVPRSLALAGVVNASLLQAGLPVTLGRATLPAVDSMTCPALAVEIAPDRSAGHSPADSFIDPAYQGRVAEALAAALLEWKTEARQP